MRLSEYVLSLELVLLFTARYMFFVTDPQGPETFVTMVRLKGTNQITETLFLKKCEVIGLVQNNREVHDVYEYTKYQ